MPLMMLSVFFEPKVAFNIYGSEETWLPTYCMMDNIGPDGAIFRISFAVVILQWRSR